MTMAIASPDTPNKFSFILFPNMAGFHRPLESGGCPFSISAALLPTILKNMACHIFHGFHPQIPLRFRAEGTETKVNENLVYSVLNFP